MIQDADMNAPATVDTKRTAVIVLGAAVLEGSVPSPTLKRRALYAAQLAISGNNLVIASGGIGRNPPSEAHVIAEICIGQNVPKNMILLEDQSKTTFENLSFSFKLGQENGCMRYRVVTDFYHLPRAWLTARALGQKVSVSAPFSGLSGTPKRRLLVSALREVIAIPFYILKLAWYTTISRLSK